MLSDQERRALEELERCFAAEAREPAESGRTTRRSARRSKRPPGRRVLLVLACVSAALVVAGVPTAGFALALATAIGWLSWRLWAHDASDRRPGESIRQYLRWLAEAE